MGIELRTRLVKSQIRDVVISYQFQAQIEHDDSGESSLKGVDFSRGKVLSCELGIGHLEGQSIE